MSTLHIVRQSAFMTSDLAQCISLLLSEDTLVLIDDGCYNLSHRLLTDLLSQPNNSITVNVIKSHAEARALLVPKGVNIIEMTALVEFTFTHQKVITWQ